MGVLVHRSGTRKHKRHTRLRQRGVSASLPLYAQNPSLFCHAGASGRLRVRAASPNASHVQ
jgi:hypothetical protein